MSNNTHKLEDLIKDFSQQKAVKKPMLEAKLINFWPELMGKVVDKYTEKIYISNKVLFIKVTVSALKSELLYGQEKIIEEMNKHANTGQVEIEKLVLL